MAFVEKGSYTGVLWWKGSPQPPSFPQLFDLLEEDFQLTLVARLVMASLWISRIHKAVASAPKVVLHFLALGLCRLMMLIELLAHFCTPERCWYLVGQRVEFKYSTVQVKCINLPQGSMMKYTLWWLVIHSVSWWMLVWIIFSIECFVLIWGFLWHLQLWESVKNEESLPSWPLGKKTSWTSWQVLWFTALYSSYRLF